MNYQKRMFKKKIIRKGTYRSELYCYFFRSCWPYLFSPQYTLISWKLVIIDIMCCLCLDGLAFTILPCWAGLCSCSGCGCRRHSLTNLVACANFPHQSSFRYMTTFRRCLTSQLSPLLAWAQTLFWGDGCLHGQRLVDLSPSLRAAIPKHISAKRTYGAGGSN